MRTTHLLLLGAGAVVALALWAAPAAEASPFGPQTPVYADVYVGFGYGGYARPYVRRRYYYPAYSYYPRTYYRPYYPPYVYRPYYVPYYPRYSLHFGYYGRPRYYGHHHYRGYYRHGGSRRTIGRRR